jgi:hypothetical protein
MASPCGKADNEACRRQGGDETAQASRSRVIVLKPVTGKKFWIFLPINVIDSNG